EKKQVPGLMFLRDGEIYIDSSVFTDIFSLNVYVNYGANTLRIKKENEEAKIPQLVLAAPKPAPAPKPVDTAVEHVTVQEIKTAAPTEPAAPPAPSTEAATAPSETPVALAPTTEPAFKAQKPQEQQESEE